VCWDGTKMDSTGTCSAAAGCSGCACNAYKNGLTTYDCYCW
jgi:hypothetical protein